MRCLLLTGPFSQSTLLLLLLISAIPIFLLISQVYLSIFLSVFLCDCLLYILLLAMSISLLYLSLLLSCSLLPPGKASGIRCTHPSLHQVSCQTERERLASCCLELMSIVQTGPGEKRSLVSSKEMGEWQSEQWRVKRGIEKDGQTFIKHQHQSIFSIRYVAKP